MLWLFQAQEAEARGDYEGMQKNRQLALILDIAGVIVGGVTFVVIVIALSVQEAWLDSNLLNRLKSCIYMMTWIIINYFTCDFICIY